MFCDHHLSPRDQMDLEYYHNTVDDLMARQQFSTSQSLVSQKMKRTRRRAMGSTKITSSLSLVTLMLLAASTAALVSLTLASNSAAVGVAIGAKNAASSSSVAAGAAAVASSVSSASLSSASSSSAESVAESAAGSTSSAENNNNNNNNQETKKGRCRFFVAKFIRQARAGDVRYVCVSEMRVKDNLHGTCRIFFVRDETMPGVCRVHQPQS